MTTRDLILTCPECQEEFLAYKLPSRFNAICRPCKARRRAAKLMSEATLEAQKWLAKVPDLERQRTAGVAKARKTM